MQKRRQSLKPKKLAVKLMKLGFLQKKVKQEAEHAKLKAEKARREAEAAKREAENHKQNLLPKGPSPLSFVLALILGWLGVHNFAFCSLWLAFCCGLCRNVYGKIIL